MINREDREKEYAELIFLLYTIYKMTDENYKNINIISIMKNLNLSNEYVN